MTSIADIRKSYERAELNEDASHADPLKQFDQWLTEAIASQLLAFAASEIRVPNNALRVIALDKDDTRGGPQIRAYGRQGHGIGLWNLGRDCFFEPLIKLVQWVGMRGAFVQLGTLVAFT